MPNDGIADDGPDGNGETTEVFKTQLLHKISSISTTIGQPITHSIDHMLSATRAAIAIKIFGDDLSE